MAFERRFVVIAGLMSCITVLAVGCAHRTRKHVRVGDPAELTWLSNCSAVVVVGRLISSVKYERAGTLVPTTVQGVFLEQATQTRINDFWAPTFAAHFQRTLPDKKVFHHSYREMKLVPSASNLTEVDRLALCQITPSIVIRGGGDMYVRVRPLLYELGVSNLEQAMSRELADVLSQRSSDRSVQHSGDSGATELDAHELKELERRLKRLPRSEWHGNPPVWTPSLSKGNRRHGRRAEYRLDCMAEVELPGLFERKVKCRFNSVELQSSMARLADRIAEELAQEIAAALRASGGTE